MGVLTGTLVQNICHQPHYFPYMQAPGVQALILFDPHRR